MDTMSVSAAAVRSTTSVADARESTREFLEGLVPTLAAEAAETVVLVVYSAMRGSDLDFRG
ncbi:hypothetical protein [Streptomyces sp. NPDC090798]|uniref:hypothetical protein n=1 Tax=Streptomyces sp. NPDC090798 TaxID=3365968 RepID=UPI00382577A5